MSPQPNTFPPLTSPIVDKNGMATWAFQHILQDWNNKLNGLAAIITQLAAGSTIQGHPGTVGSIVQNLDANGVATAAGVDFTRAYVGKDLSNVPDSASADRHASTANQKTGGDRGFQALDGNNRIASGFNNNPVNVSNAPTSSTALSNTGASTAIAVAATTQQFDFGTVSYNSGSIDPGVYGTFYVYADDPTYAGGTVSYQFSTTPPTQAAAKGRILFGAITTVGGSAKTGGGYSGGTTTGGSGGRGYLPGA